MNRLQAAAFALSAPVLALAAREAVTMPAFARRYEVSCAHCHHPFPKVKLAGEQFAGHGFRMAPGEAAHDTVGIGDELLALPRHLPLAVRADAQIQLFEDGGTATDFQAPWMLKLISSAPLSRDLSYYFYFLLDERGEAAGVEDAFVHWNDLGGRPVDLVLGQFQVSDPLFKRELRLMFEDYAIYRAHVGAQEIDLTYDRGLMLMADVAGFGLTAELVNGNGLGPAGADRRLDDNDWKNVFGHLTRDLVLGRARLGALGYLGRTDGDGPSGGRVRSETWMAGLDATITSGPADLNLQYVHREDRLPTFTPGEPDAITDGGFVELVVAPEEGRTYGFALYNRVVCDRPLLDPRVGGQAGVSRFQTAAIGLGHLVARNARVQLELGYDLETDAKRATAGITLAY